MEILNSDQVDWPNLFLENDYIVVNYQPEIDCPGCKEMNFFFEDFARKHLYKNIKFLWIDSRNNPVAEQFIKKRQMPFIAAFKSGFLVECDNISTEKGLRGMIERLFAFKFKL
jgi:hypothetical protein